MRFLAERTQFRRDRVVPIARKHLLPDPLFFRCIFSGRSRRSERHVATRIGAARSESDNLKGWDCDERAALAEAPAAGRRRRAQAEREVLWPQAEREVPGMARAAARVVPHVHLSSISGRRGKSLGSGTTRSPRS